MIVGDRRMIELQPGKQDRETMRYESQTDTRHRHSKECLLARDDGQKGMQQSYRIQADREAKKKSAHCCGILPGNWQAARHTAEEAVTREFASIIQTTTGFHKEPARVLTCESFVRPTELSCKPIVLVTALKRRKSRTTTRTIRTEYPL